MESLELDTLWQWFGYTAQLVQRVCVVVVAAFACIHLSWVRRALRGRQTFGWQGLMMGLLFGLFAIIATHSGILLEIGEQNVREVDWFAGALFAGLGEYQVVLGFRDTMVLTAGLVGGPWVGLIAGMMAGYERYLLGGFAHSASGSATVILGLVAGLARWFDQHRAMAYGNHNRFISGAGKIFPRWLRRLRLTDPLGALLVAIFCTALQRVIILLFAKPHAYAVVLSWNIFLPVAVANTLGCVLFIWVLRDLDRDRLENERQDAELRALQAVLDRDRMESERQEWELCALREAVESHFIHQILSPLRFYVIPTHPEMAQEYLFKLEQFFKSTLSFAGSSTMPLRKELEQLARYMDLLQLYFIDKKLNFGEKFQFAQADISASLLDCHLPPRSLITLAGNAVTHGIVGCTSRLIVKVDAVDHGDSMEIRVTDNGCGIESERRDKLGKEPVDSPSNGVALYQLKRSLDLAFRGRAGLSINSEPGVGTEVVLTLPKLKNENL